MTTQQKIALRNIFIEAWKSETPFTELADSIRDKAVAAGLWEEDAKFTTPNMRAAYLSMGSEYSNPRTRSRSVTVDFSDLVSVSTDPKVAYRGSDQDLNDNLADPDEYKTEQMESNGASNSKW